jgi:hypothetical protein
MQASRPLLKTQYARSRIDPVDRNRTVESASNALISGKPIILAYHSYGLSGYILVFARHTLNAGCGGTVREHVRG